MTGKKHHPRRLAPRYWCSIDSCTIWGYGNGAYINEVVKNVWICKAHYSWIRHQMGNILTDYMIHRDRDRVLHEINEVYDRVIPKTLEDSLI